MSQERLSIAALENGIRAIAMLQLCPISNDPLASCNSRHFLEEMLQLIDSATDEDLNAAVTAINDLRRPTGLIRREYFEGPSWAHIAQQICRFARDVFQDYTQSELNDVPDLEQFESFADVLNAAHVVGEIEPEAVIKGLRQEQQWLDEGNLKLDQLFEWAQPTKKIDPLSDHLPGTEKEEAVWLGNGNIRIGAVTEYLTAQSHCDFIEFLLENGGKAVTPQFAKSVVLNPSKTAREILDFNNGVLKPYIEIPNGRRGKGYRTSIRDGRHSS